MRAWIGCLASYNNGVLFGQWFDVSTDADANQDNINDVLRRSPYPNVTRTDDAGKEYRTAEEYMVSDYEAPKALADLLGEYPGAASLADAARLEDAIAERYSDPDERDAVLGVMLDGAGSRDLAGFADDADDWLSDRVAGEGDNLADWCSEFLTDTDFFGSAFRDKDSDQAATIERYFDFESYARDLALGGDISTVRVGGKVLVFWNR